MPSQSPARSASAATRSSSPNQRRQIGVDAARPAHLDDHRVACRFVGVGQIAAGNGRGVGNGGRQGDALQRHGRIDPGLALVEAADLLDAPQQAAQMVAARAVVEEVDFIQDDGAQRRQQARRTGQQRVGRFGRRDQHGGRPAGGDGAGVAAFHAQRDAQLRQRRGQTLVEIAHQRACRADVEDMQFRGSVAGDESAQNVALQQRRDHRLGLAGGRRCDDQCVVPRENGWNRPLLNRREAAVTGEEGRPGVEELPSESGSGPKSLRFLTQCYQAALDTYQMTVAPDAAIW